jgi:hypothetical protein
VTTELRELISEAGDELSEIVNEAVAGIELFSSLLQLRRDLDRSDAA